MGLKKILVVVPSYDIGGTTISLYSLLSLLSPSKIKVDIFALNRKGVYKDLLSNCTILDENVWLSVEYHGGNIVKKRANYLINIIRRIFKKLGIDICPLLYRIGGKQIHSDSYDAIISYAESISKEVSYYPAKKRIAWIHCDYSRYLSLLGYPNESDIYSGYNNIVCVSDYAKSTFIKELSQYKNKVVTINNIINVSDIHKKALDNKNLDPQYDNSVFTIVSIGRLDPVKQFDMIPQIASNIKQMTDIPFRWYIIGGSRGFEKMEQQILDDINRYDLNNVVIRLTEKNNIYPYLLNSDLYVCTSKSESYPLAVNEAKALGISILSNNFPSSKESITEGKDGWIVSIEEMTNFIVRILKGDINLVKCDPIELIQRNEKILYDFYNLF